MKNEKPEKDLERVGSFPIPKPSLQERILGIAATTERIVVKAGKVGLVLVVIATASFTWGNWEEAEYLSRQVDLLATTAYSPDRAWVAHELSVQSGTGDRSVPGTIVPTGRYVCGKAGEVPKECTPDPSVAQTAELCVLPWTAENWPKIVRPVGAKPDEFGTPEMCPESILHPGK